MSWSDKFRSKSQRKLEEEEAELKHWKRQKDSAEKEIMQGAPLRDWGGVVSLKADLGNAINEIGKAERRIAKLREKVEAERAMRR